MGALKDEIELVPEPDEKQTQLDDLLKAKVPVTEEEDEPA